MQKLPIRVSQGGVRRKSCKYFRLCREHGRPARIFRNTPARRQRSHVITTFMACTLIKGNNQGLLQFLMTLFEPEPF